VEVEAFAVINLVEKIEAGWLDEAPIWTNLKTFDARPFRGVDVLSGGFPCQPFSHAGRQQSTEDPRHLFPDIERIISECAPRIVFLENVEGIISAKVRGEPDTSVLHHVLQRLEGLGYRCTTGIFSAEECGAPHQRKRVFICAVADDDFKRLKGEQTVNGSEASLEECGGGHVVGQGDQGDLADTSGKGLQGCKLSGSHRKLSGEGGEGTHGPVAQCRCEYVVADTVGERHGGRTKTTGRQGSPSEPDHGNNFRCKITGHCQVGDTTSDGCDTRQSDTEAGGLDGCRQEGRVQESAGGCSELGDTQHDGSPTNSERRGNTEDGSGTEEGSNTTIESEGTSGPSEQRDIQGGELADTNPIGGGQDSQSAKAEGTDRIVQSSSSVEQLPNPATEGLQGSEYEEHHITQCYSSLVPSRPGQEQHFWEAPRTIGDEKIITPVGVSNHAIDADVVRRMRVDSLRLLGNGCVPTTVSKAFLILINELFDE